MSRRVAPPSVHNSCCCWRINKLPAQLNPLIPHLESNPPLLLEIETSNQHTNEEQEADRPRRCCCRREPPHHKQRQQDGAQGRGEEPQAPYEGTLPQALLSRSGLLSTPPPPLLHFLLFLAAVQQQGRGDAAGPAGQRGGVHQAAPGPDRRPQAPQAGGPLRRHRWLLILRLRRRLQVTDDDGAAGDRGAAPGRNSGRGAGERGRAAVPAARGDRRAGAGGRRGGQRQLLSRRGQDLLHRPLPGALPPHRPRGRPRRPPAPRPRRGRLVLGPPDMICLSLSIYFAMAT